MPDGIESHAYDGTPGLDAFNRLNRLIGSERFHVELGRVYRLEDAETAHREIAKHHLGQARVPRPRRRGPGTRLNPRGNALPRGGAQETARRLQITAVRPRARSVESAPRCGDGGDRRRDRHVWERRRPVVGPPG